MTEITEIDDKYIVIKKDDINQILDDQDITMLNHFLSQIRLFRKSRGKKVNQYIILNLDDEFSMPYLNARIQDIITERMYGIMFEKKKYTSLKIKDISVILVNAILKAKE